MSLRRNTPFGDAINGVSLAISVRYIKRRCRHSVIICDRSNFVKVSDLQEANALKTGTISL
jgi:hypothetical protein